MNQLMEEPAATAVVKFNVTDESIAELRARMTGLTCATPADYELVRVSIAECRELRVAVENRRVELKADALEWGRKVDREAKRITAALESIENPLKAAKKLVDDEAERVKQEKADAIRRQMEEAAAKRREAEEARMKAERDAEEARIAEERRKLEEEQKRLSAERQALQAEQDRMRAAQDAAAKAEQERIDAERREIETQRRKLEQEEFERQAKIKAEQDARDKAERERIEQHEREVAAQKRQAELAALRPDIEKVATFADMLRAIEAPKVKSAKVRGRLNEAIDSIRAVADQLSKSEF